VVPRQIAMYLAKQLTECSLPEIGRQFGGNITLLSCTRSRKIIELRKSDKDLNRVLNQLTEHLTALGLRFPPSFPRGAGVCHG